MACESLICACSPHENPVVGLEHRVTVTVEPGVVVISRVILAFWVN
jgi:hypothetical protein